MKFRLKSLLLSVFCVAASIALYLRISEHYYWQRLRSDVAAWSNNVSRTQGFVSPFLHVDSAGRRFAVSTAEPYQDTTIAGDRWWAIDSPSPRRENGYFVMPPGIWVNSVDDVLQIWRDL